MVKTIKIIAFSLVFIMAFADEEHPRAVYFGEGTPFLVEISQLLEEHDYELLNDSLKASYYGELFCYMEGRDSIRCEVQLQKGQESPFILDSFITEPVDDRNVRHSVVNFSIWMLLLNALTAILFFVRST
jgi:hypothetical protein